MELASVLTVLVEVVVGIPLALVCLAFVVAMAAFTYPRFARWLEALTVPRWPRTQGWFYDSSSDRARKHNVKWEPLEGTVEPGPVSEKDPFGRSE